MLSGYRDCWHACHLLVVFNRCGLAFKPVYNRAQARQNFAVYGLSFAQLGFESPYALRDRSQMLDFSSETLQLGRLDLILPCPLQFGDSFLQELRRGLLHPSRRVRDLSSELFDVDGRQNSGLRLLLTRRRSRP